MRESLIPFVASFQNLKSRSDDVNTFLVCVVEQVLQSLVVHHHVSKLLCITKLVYVTITLQVTICNAHYHNMINNHNH